MQKIIMAVALITLLLSACGGGGGGDSPPPRSATFSGTVAIGAPLAGASVMVINESGAAAFATTDAAGRYSVTLSGLPLDARPLFIIQTHDPAAGVLSAPVQYPRLYSIANSRSGTVNLTPLTSLLVARLLGEKQGLFANLLTMRSLPTIPSDGEIAAARQQVVDYLRLQRPDPNNGNATVVVDASAVTDFIRSPFNAVPGNPHDDAIEALALTFMAGETIEGVEEHMLARLDGPADLTAVLSLDFVAHCVAEGNLVGLPTGLVNVTFAPTGQITIGSFAYMLATNDRVTRANAPFFDERWLFELIGSGPSDQLELTEAGRRLNSLRLAALGGTIRCTPTVELPLGTRIPSTLAQIRKLADDFFGPSPSSTFTCTDSAAFPGINDGANVLEIQNNGALRVQAGGYALHLPSSGVALTAVATNSGGVLSTRVTAARFTRIFAGGFDELMMTLNTVGNIQSINFSQQRNGAPSVGTNC
jgi:hypothetical protein